MGLALTPPVFAIMRQLIEERAGLNYQPTDMELLEQKLSSRAGELGFESLLDYYYYLRYDPGGSREMQGLLETLVVHETYFFREADALAVVVESIVPELLRKRRLVRIWSAACATGEEPYTIAMMLAGAGLLDRVQILASDISERALARAREGVYTGRSLRAIGDLRAPTPYLIEDVRGSLRVRDDIREKISWRRVNLVDPVEVRGAGMFEVVVCRNVLIYFADTIVASVAASLSEVIEQDGFLVVGTSESLLRFGTIYECEERRGSFFYRKQPA